MTESTKPIILAIETATRAGSVSVARANTVLASRQGDPQSSHSTDLIESIDRVLKDAGTDLQSVEVFAAAIGPGSFTGLRIGLATAKSLAVTLNRKCVGVSTLQAIAYQAGPSPRTVALLPAGRGELFAQMFNVNAAGAAPLDRAMHLTPSTTVGKYGKYENLTWAGEGAQVQSEFLRGEAASRNVRMLACAPVDNGDSPAWFLAPTLDYLADAVAQIAYECWRSGDLIAPEDLRADYVRPSDAEINSKD